MAEPTTQPVEHCPRFPEHCSLECMERMRAEFGSYRLNEPPFEDWCPMAEALRRQEDDRRRFEADKMKALHHREFPEDPAD